MKRPLLLLALLLAFPLSLAAQNPVTSDSKNYFSLGASASGFIGTSGGSQSATVESAWLNITKRVSLGYEVIIIPSTATFHFGMVAYQLPLSSLVGKKLSGHFLFDASRISVGFHAGAGKVLQTNETVNRLAEIVGMSLSYPLANHIDFQVVSASWVHGGVTNGIVTTPSAAAISSGIGINF